MGVCVKPTDGNLQTSWLGSDLSGRHRRVEPTAVRFGVSGSTATI